MATHPSAEKRHRQSQTRRTRNSAAQSAMRTAVKKARRAIEEKAENRSALVKTAVTAIYWAASKNVITKNTASRSVSRLMQAENRAS